MPARSGDGFLVSLPLVPDSSGTRRVSREELIDATPLSNDESREMVELERELARQRVRERRKKFARLRALKQRAIYAPLMTRQLRELAQRQARAA